MNTFSTSDVPKISLLKQQDGVPPLGQSLVEAGLTPTMIRFVGHLPFFKVASAAFLPVGMGLSGVVVTTFVYSLLCLGLTRWLGARQLPFTACAVLLGAMMIVGPSIALAFPEHPLELSEFDGVSSVMLPYFLMLLPICGGYCAMRFVIDHLGHSQVTRLRLGAQDFRK